MRSSSKSTTPKWCVLRCNGCGHVSRDCLSARSAQRRIPKGMVICPVCGSVDIKVVREVRGEQ